MDNHCENLEAEIDRATKELEVAAKKLHELSALKEQLSPELERLKVGELQLKFTSSLVWLGHMEKLFCFPFRYFSCRSLFVQEVDCV